MTARFLDISAPHFKTPHCVDVEFVQTSPAQRLSAPGPVSCQQTWWKFSCAHQSQIPTTNGTPDYGRPVEVYYK